MGVIEPSRQPGNPEIRQLARVMDDKYSLFVMTHDSARIFRLRVLGRRRGEQAPSLRPPPTSGRQAPAETAAMAA